jgi:hypothetical protein
VPGRIDMADMQIAGRARSEPRYAFSRNSPQTPPRMTVMPGFGYG